MSVAYTTIGGWIDWDDFFASLDEMGYEEVDDAKASADKRLISCEQGEIWCYRNEDGHIGSWEVFGTSQVSDILAPVETKFGHKIVDDLDDRFWWQ